jgi:hypothetical protein
VPAYNALPRSSQPEAHSDHGEIERGIAKKSLTKKGHVASLLARSTTKSRRLFENQVEMEVRARSRI